MNFDLSPFVQASLLLQQVIGTEISDAQPKSLFQDDWHEQISLFVSNWARENHTTINRLDRADKRALVIALYESGAFKASGAVVYASRILSLGRATVYKYIQESKDSATLG